MTNQPLTPEQLAKQVAWDSDWKPGYGEIAFGILEEKPLDTPHKH